MDIADASIQIGDVGEVLSSLLTENKSIKEFINDMYNESLSLKAVVSAQDKEFKLLQSKMKDQINTIANLKEISETYSNETHSLKSLVQNQAKKISALQEINSKKSKEIDELEKESLENFNKITKLQNQTGDFGNRLTLLEMKLFSPTGVFIWKVDHLDEKVKQNGVDFSECFYSHIDGYKMWLWLFSGGTQEFRGTHLSLQFQVLDGENDEKLSWPFHNNLNLGIIVRSQPLKVLRYKQKCLIKKNGLSPLFNFSFEDLSKHRAIDNNSIVIIYSFEDFRTDNILV